MLELGLELGVGVGLGLGLGLEGLRTLAFSCTAPMSPRRGAPCLPLLHAWLFGCKGCILADPTVVQTVYVQRSNQCL